MNTVHRYGLVDQYRDTLQAQTTREGGLILTVDSRANGLTKVANVTGLGQVNLVPESARRLVAAMIDLNDDPIVQPPDDPRAPGLKTRGSTIPHWATWGPDGPQGQEIVVVYPRPKDGGGLILAVGRNSDTAGFRASRDEAEQLIGAFLALLAGTDPGTNPEGWRPR